MKIWVGGQLLVTSCSKGWPVKIHTTRRHSIVKLWSCASRDHGFGRVGSQSKACNHSNVQFILKVDRFTNWIWFCNEKQPPWSPPSDHCLCRCESQICVEVKFVLATSWTHAVVRLRSMNKQILKCLSQEVLTDLVPRFWVSTELPTLMWSCPRMEPLELVTGCYYLLKQALGE